MQNYYVLRIRKDNLVSYDITCSESEGLDAINFEAVDFPEGSYVDRVWEYGDDYAEAIGRYDYNNYKAITDGIILWKNTISNTDKEQYTEYLKSNFELE